MFLQNVEDRFTQISLCSKLNMVTLILGDGLEKGIQGFGQLLRLNPFLLGLIFLLEDKSAQTWTQNLDSRLLKLAGEDFSIEISLILNKLPALADDSRKDQLGRLENQLIAFLEMLLVFLQGKVVGRRLSALIQKQSVKGKVNLQDGEVLKIFLNALYRENFFGKGFFSYLMGPVLDLLIVIVSPFRVNLSDPPGIPITRHPDRDIRMQSPEAISFKVRFFFDCHPEP
jgi:hypothetical protein